MRAWLIYAYEAANKFSGTEDAEKRLLKPLTLFEAFVCKQTGSLSPENEQQIISEAFGEAAGNYPSNVVGFLGVATRFYDRMKASATSADLIDYLKGSGAAIEQSPSVFIKTDEGRLLQSGEASDQSYDVRTQPRLAILLEKLREDGVNGQPIYVDDVVITQGKVDPSMMREHPYIIVQIPRLNCEIALCEQIGEITFVKRGTVGSEFWAYLSKDRLKEREDITPVIFREADRWWKGLAGALGKRAEPVKKVDVTKWRKKRPNLDLELVKKSLLAHRLTTGQRLTQTKAQSGGKKGSYVLEHGPYALKITCGTLNASLYIGSNGLTGGNSIANLNQEISEEQGLDYKNYTAQEPLDIELIKDSLLAHRLATGEWLSSGESKPGGKRGSYILEHGHYAGDLTCTALETALSLGKRGLPSGSSIAKLNQEISDMHALDYRNHLTQEPLDVELIKESLLAHRLATGEWISAYKAGPSGKQGSYILEHGPYAGELRSGLLDGALREGSRGLPSGLSIAKLNQEISEEQGLDYKNKLAQEPLDIELIKDSLLAHRLATGEWLSSGESKPGGKRGSYILEHGHYAGDLTCTALETALSLGKRGLPGGSSIAKLNQEISDMHALDYRNHLTQEDLDIEWVKESLLAHRLATGEWLSGGKSRPGGSRGSYILKFGHYANAISCRNLENALSIGLRGLSGGTTIAILNQDISDEHNLDYKRKGRRKKPDDASPSPDP